MDNFFSRFVLADQRVYWFARHFLFWFSCWVFMGIIYGFLYVSNQQPITFSISFLESALFLPQHMVLSYGIIYYVLPHFIFQGHYWKGFGTVLLLILFASAMSPMISVFVIAPIRDSLSLPSRHTVAFYSLLAGLRGSMTVAGFAVALKLVKHWYFKTLENDQLEKEKLKAELQVLRGQLHPHFIFNTLNSIYSQSLKKSEEVPNSILKLSELLRYMFTECNENVVPLENEIQVLNHYSALAKSRFADRLDLAVNIRGDIQGKGIAPLLLLPFFENSFKYGTNEMLEDAWISLDLVVKDDVLKFKLMNGKARSRDSQIVSSGIGLQNVKKRLEMLYPESHTLRITEDEEIFIVQLSLKLENLKLLKSDEKIAMSVS
jgi:sensor histidine kinase YesM